MFIENLKKGQHIHMIGIGGISMSALAELLTHWGYKVTGSDLKSSDITEKLEKSGIKVYIPHNAQNIEGAEAVVYTAAIKNDNPELVKAKNSNIPIVDRATLLGEITKIYPKTIAVSGTHGKTTTTSMIGATLVEANYDPTIMVGGKIDSIGGNYRIGNSDFFVTEACEYVESFLKFYPKIGVILNIEPDHLDYFRNLEHIKSAFEKFANRIPKDGAIIANFDDQNTYSTLKNIDRNIITYGINNKSVDWKAENIVKTENGCFKFDTIHKNQNIGTIQLSIPGLHNVYNALACLAVCNHLGIEFNVIQSALKNFTGAKRRFEYKGTINGITIIDDYAHHPSEVKATLAAAIQQSPRALWCIFQPHTYTRTKALLAEFSEAFMLADKVIVLDIYAARESNTGLIHSKDLVKAINEKTNNAVYAPNFHEAVKLILKEALPGDLVITMGAGDVDKVGNILLEYSTKEAV